jgi:hypothetical protein
VPSLGGCAPPNGPSLEAEHLLKEGGHVQMRLRLVASPPQMQLTLENAQPAEMEHLSLRGRCSGLLHKTPVIFMKMPREMSRVSNHVMRYLFDVAVTRAVSTCCGGRRNSAGWRRMKTESNLSPDKKTQQSARQQPAPGSWT